MSEAPLPPAATNERRLAVIVFTDVVGYSARMQQDETGTMALVLADFATMRGLCTQHGGEVLKSTGDGLLLCFSSVVQAVACALEIQRQFAVHGPAGLQHRIGIHLGDVFRAGGDVTGDGVNIAARLEAKARPGTICVSQSVHDAVKGKLPMQAEALGPQSFKNIAEPINVYLLAPAGSAQPRPRPKPGRRTGWVVAGAVIVAAGALALLLGPGRHSGAATSSAAPTEAVRLADQARSIVGGPDPTRDDAVLAEQLAQKATELEPASAAGWAVLGYINFYSFQRGWDISPARLETARANARRALTLAPGNAEALLTQALVINLQGGDKAQAEALFREALVANPRDNRIRRGLSVLLLQTNRRPAALALLEEAIAIDPNDAITHYTLAVNAVATWNYPAAMTALDAAIAARPFGNARNLRAMAYAIYLGDLPAMRRELEELKPEERAEDRGVYMRVWCALMERAPARALEAAQLTSRDYLDDNFFRAPKGWFTGRAHAMLGQDGLAQLDFAAAETVVRARLARAPGNPHDRICLAITLALQNREAEARAEIAPIEAAARDQPRAVRLQLLAIFHAVLGDAARAAAYLRQVDDPVFGAFASITPPVLRLDPWWDRIRDQPEFIALLDDPTYCPAYRRTAPSGPRP